MTTDHSTAQAENPAPPIRNFPDRVEPNILGGAFNLFAEAYAREEARIAKFRRTDDEIANDTDPDGDHL
jgi:hypothetical protein